MLYCNSGLVTENVFAHIGSQALKCWESLAN
uniref:Uncharacterized protein n=1 Tax=Anguilla anguilla TaxID=7936 RepID=A0A0E9TT60_ANGAN